MTKQRFSDIENAVLVGLLEAPEHNELPFQVDPSIFSTPLKQKIAITLNKYLQNGDPHLAAFNFNNAVDDDPNLQDEWMQMQEKTWAILPETTLKKYYDSLLKEKSKNSGERI